MKIVTAQILEQDAKEPKLPFWLNFNSLSQIGMSLFLESDGTLIAQAR